ncbi:hypothetical protein DFA_10896 [Cavenderia fasciculata]|uniref:Ankyrin repeat-containing protein n=1 Tax=Cavenderia fasciculata TaxID=261658 RepID=F4QBQ0_CACFS|nr:uncharacterized protein DFA_10896 [Cavenderia fasciculata]EGG14638.1 hypothetical protein DFA_10896 [Cavenderia fasciculata]|eukprot:XP_004351146.1 hypothetical protein DFA_10896 [Cavenderia fasciculata]
MIKVDLQKVKCSSVFLSTWHSALFNNQVNFYQNFNQTINSIDREMEETFTFIIKNKYLWRKILGHVPTIHAQLGLVSYRFREIPSDRLSYLTFNIVDDQHIDRSLKEESNIKLLCQKLKYDKLFILYFNSMPKLLRYCKNLQFLKLIHRRFPLYFGHRLAYDYWEKNYPSAKTRPPPHESCGDCYESPSWVVDNIAASGRLDCLCYAIEKYNIAPTTTTMLMAAEHGHHHIIHYLNRQYNIQVPDTAYELASYKGKHINVIRYLSISHPNVKITILSLINAVHSTNIEIVILLFGLIDEGRLENPIELLKIPMVDHAIKSKSLEMVQLVYQRFGDKYLSGWGYDDLAEFGLVDIFAWLYKRSKVRLSDRTVFLATHSEPLTRYIYANCPKEFRKSNNVFERACQRASLQTIKFLVENSVNPIQESFRTAALRGDLQIVIWLRENVEIFGGPISPLITKDVALTGTGNYVGVVKYLLECGYSESSFPPGFIMCSLLDSACSRDSIELFSTSLEHFKISVPLRLDDISNRPDVSIVTSYLNQPHSGPGRDKMVAWLIPLYQVCLQPDHIRGFVIGCQSAEPLRLLWDINEKIVLENIWRCLTKGPDPLEILQLWFEKNKLDGFSSHITDYLAVNGSIKSLKFLHRVGGHVYFSSGTLARCTEIDIFEWFSKETMTTVIQKGHYEIIQFLFLNIQSEEFIDPYSLIGRNSLTHMQKFALQDYFDWIIKQQLNGKGLEFEEENNDINEEGSLEYCNIINQDQYILEIENENNNNNNEITQQNNNNNITPGRIKGMLGKWKQNRNNINSDIDLEEEKKGGKIKGLMNKWQQRKEDR